MLLFCSVLFLWCTHIYRLLSGKVPCISFTLLCMVPFRQNLVQDNNTPSIPHKLNIEFYTKVKLKCTKAKAVPFLTNVRVYTGKIHSMQSIKNFIRVCVMVFLLRGLVSTTCIDRMLNVTLLCTRIITVGYNPYGMVPFLCTPARIPFSTTMNNTQYYVCCYQEYVHMRVPTSQQ